MDRCLNCATPLNGAYCSQCGQSAGTHRIGWPWLLHELQHSILHVDKGLLYTLKELFTRPGRAIRGFLEGRRIQHYKPIALVTLLAAIYSFGFFLLRPEMSTVRMDPSAKESFDTMMSVVMGYYALFELCSIPVFAFWSWLLMRRYGHNFAEHLVINTFLGGQRIAVNIMGLPSNLLGFEASMVYTSLAYLIYLGYYVFAFAQLYEDRKGIGHYLRPIAAFTLFWLVILIVIVASVVVLLLRAQSTESLH